VIRSALTRSTMTRARFPTRHQEHLDMRTQNHAENKILQIRTSCWHLQAYKRKPV